MSAMTSREDEAVLTMTGSVMTGTERAAMLARLTQACTTSVVAPVGASRNRPTRSGHAAIMWRCQ